jgi:hypothetical protein
MAWFTAEGHVLNAPSGINTVQLPYVREGTVHEEAN